MTSAWEIPLSARLDALPPENREYFLRFLPFHLAAAGDQLGLIELICDLDFIRAKCASGRAAELLTDFALAATQVYGDSSSKSPRFETLAGAGNEPAPSRVVQAVLDGQSIDDDGAAGPILRTLRALPDALRNRERQIPLANHEHPLPPGRFAPGCAAEFIRSEQDRMDAELKTVLPDSLSQAKARLNVFSRFVQRHATIFHRHPDLVVQSARNWAYTGIVGEIAARAVKRGQQLHILRDPRPKVPPAASPCVRILRNDFGTLHGLALSADGVWAITGAAKMVKIWNLRAGYCHRVFKEHEFVVIAVALSGDASTAASLDVNGLIVVRQNPLEAGEAFTIAAPSARCLAMTPDGDCLIVGTDDGRVRVWSLRSKQCVREWLAHPTKVHAISLTPDARLALTGSDHGMAQVWDLTNGKPLRTLFGGTQSREVSAVTITGNGAVAAIGYGDRSIRLWDVATGDYLRRMSGLHKGKITAVSLSDDGSVLASGDSQRRLCVWTCDMGNLVYAFDEHTRAISGVCAIGSGRFIASAGVDDTLRVWDVASPRPESRPWGHTEAVYSVTLSDDLLNAISGSKDRTVRLWDAKTGYCLQTLDGHQSPIYHTIFLPARNRGLSAAGDGTLQCWHLRTGGALRILAEDHKALLHFAVNSARTMAVTVRRSRIGKIWRLAEAAEGPVLSFAGEAKTVGWTANDDVVVIDEAGRVRRYKGSDGALVSEWAPAIDQIWSSALSRNGMRLAIADRQHHVHVFESETGSPLFVCDADENHLSGLRFGVADDVLAGFDTQGRIIFWGLEGGKKICDSRVLRENGSIFDLKINRQSNRAVCAHGAALALIDLNSGQVISHYFCESQISSVSPPSETGQMVLGTRLGQMHFLQVPSWASPEAVGSTI